MGEEDGMTSPKNIYIGGNFSWSSSILAELELEMLVFVKGENLSSWRKTLNQGENQQQTQPT